jgi:hypothetical protein
VGQDEADAGARMDAGMDELGQAINVSRYIIRIE